MKILLWSQISSLWLCFPVLCFLNLSVRRSTVFRRNVKHPETCPPFKRVPLNRTACQSEPIGVSNSSIIPDDRFSATSQYNDSRDDSRYQPHCARLNASQRCEGWVPKNNINRSDYLQIDLGAVFIVCAIATQGHAHRKAWTKEYKISTSIDNKTWTTYKSQSDEKVKLFPGNTNNYDVKKNDLETPVGARFIRLIPTEYQVLKSLRVEVYKSKKVQGIRLTGGSTPNQGYVELKLDDRWGKICADSWKIDESRITCNMLGMTGKASPWSPPLIRDLPTILHLYKCQSNEVSLADCQSFQRQQNCPTFFTRGVSCGNPTVNVKTKQVINRAKTKVQNKRVSYADIAPITPIDNQTSAAEKSNPWIQHERNLERLVYIYAVTLNRSCQDKNDSQYHIPPVVIVYNSNSGRSIPCKVTMDTGNEQKAKCDVEFKTDIVRIRSSDENVKLKLCSEPIVSALDNLNNMRGVSFELWNKYTTSNKSTILKYNEVFKGPPNISSISPTFTIPGFSGLTYYSVREKGYVMVNTSQLYTISASCGEECEIWLKRVQEPELDANSRNSADEDLLIKIESPTYPTRYTLSESQYENQKFSKCHLYHMEVYMRQRKNQDYLTVVTCNGGPKKNQLFPPEFLYWMRPGLRYLDFNFTNKTKSKIAFASEITFEAVYKFCCKGILCPSCPLVLELKAFDQSIMVNSSLKMTCEEHKMEHKMEAIAQQDSHSIEIVYYFLGNDDITQWKGTRRIKSIQVYDAAKLKCTFHDGICPRWNVTPSHDTPCKWSYKREERGGMQKYRGGFIALSTIGKSSLGSPIIPWKVDYENISLCVAFSYLLPTNTSSSLKVYRKTNSSEDLRWLLSGHHGVNWQQAKIRFTSKESFQIYFTGYSAKNGSISVAIKDFEVNNSRSCPGHLPQYAKPGFKCGGQWWTNNRNFKCDNGQCINKNQRCNLKYGECLDGSDEEGCVCQTGYFACANQDCIPQNKLCDGNRDCPDGEDEIHCDRKCSEHQCLDGKCITCGQQMSCEDETHSQFCDVLGTSQTKNVSWCNIQRACDFSNGFLVCGFQNTNRSTLHWKIKTNEDEEIFLHLESSENTKNGYGIIKKHWNTTESECMQFRYKIPDKSNSSLRVFFNTNLLWETSTITSEWAFGQVEIPRNSSGEVIIIGNVSKRYIDIDDVRFVEVGCAPAYFFRNPSMHRYTIFGNSKDEDQKSFIIHPKAEGWRCLRFWFYSERKNFVFGRKLAIEFQTENKTTEEWNYGSWTDEWIFNQLPISEMQERLQINIKRQIHKQRVNDLTFSKEHCLKIPAHQECQNYKTLSYSDRRKDVTADSMMFRGCDHHFSTTAWYRVIGSAGNQLARSCIKRKSSCSTKYMGWINGSLPSVEDGIVRRPLCFASEDKCCIKETVVRIRNCKEYFIYQFPKKVPPCPSKYCTTYRQKSTYSNVTSEWKNWVKGRDENVHWKVLDTNAFEKVAYSIKALAQKNTSVHDKELDIMFWLHENHSINVEINETESKEMTLCLWMSTNATWPVEIKFYLKSKIIAVNINDDIKFKRNRTKRWSHICVTLMFNFGVWNTYIDGSAINHENGTLDRQELYRGNRISVTFASRDQKTEVRYSRLNAWKNVLSEQYILYMSYECGTETGNLLGWTNYLNTLPRNSNDFRISESNCRGKEGYVQSVINPSFPETPSLATLESPRYERSSSSSLRCLRFRYKIWGPGSRSLKIYQELDDKEYTKRPIWMVKENEDSRWQDGQVALVAVTAYKLFIEGNITNKAGLLSIGALHTVEGCCRKDMISSPRKGSLPMSDCTEAIPKSSKEACNEILTNKTGYIMSPLYPGCYEDNVNCTWTIKASKEHLIRLEFKAFELEHASKCKYDYVEVYDGEVSLQVSRVGRFCGIRFPKMIQLHSNAMKIIFISDGSVKKTGFKAYYRIMQDSQDSDCVQECPSACKCRRQADGGIIITSTELNYVPNRLSNKTTAILFSGNQIREVPTGAFCKLVKLHLIDLSLNKMLVIEKRSFEDLPSLITLRLNQNFIREVRQDMFRGLKKLRALDLGDNLISEIKYNIFSGFPALRSLSLRFNRIKKLDKLTFQNNTNLTYLYLQNNFLKRIPSGVFRHQKNLVVLLLHENRIEKIEKKAFEGLGELQKLTLKKNLINEQTVSSDIFNDLHKLEYMSADSFIICCYATNAIPKLNCESPDNDFSSCRDMLKSIYVRICIWVEGISAFLGNLAVIMWWTFLSLPRRGRPRRKINSVQSLLLRHLAFADLLMGIYLLIIGTYAEIWKGKYFLHDVEWRAGVTCKIAGAISTLSSEVSVMILVAVTADRMNVILFQFSARRISLKRAHILCLFIWIVGFIMSFIPVLVPSYFIDKVSGFSFYGRSTVCLPLQLSTDLPPGWEYSVALFIGFNGAAFLYILVGYIAILVKVRKSGQKVRSKSSAESSVGKRIFFVILTDFCSWMPIMVLGVLSLIGKFNDPSVYIWIAAFVLPINSAINPILYTFSSTQTMNILSSIRGKWANNQQ